MAKPLTIQTIFSAIDKMSGPIKTMRGNTFKFSKETSAAFKKAGELGKKAGLALLGGAALLGKGLMDFAERGDDIARNAQILGLSTDAYQELSAAAKMADIDQEAFTAGTKKLSKNVGDLRMKQGTLYDLLAKMNPKLAFQLRDAKSTDDAFMDVAAAIAKETNVQKKAQLAMAAFGKTGQDMIPMMEDLAAARDKARKSGNIMTKEQTQAAEALDDSIKKIKMSGMGLLSQLLAPLAAKLAPIIDKMTAWVDANKELVATKIGNVINTVWKGIEFLTQPWVLKGIAALAISIKAMSLAMMVLGAGSPWVLAIGALATLVTLIIANWDKIAAFFDKLAQGGAAADVMVKEKTPANMQSALARGGMTAGLGGAPLPGMYDRGGFMPALSGATSSQSTVDINIGGLPAGSSVKQRGDPMPGALNTGRQMAGGTR
jgi:hypothetical protein